MKKFIIEHIDPLGQGVFKENEDIYFIPKTLPEESGTFRVLRKKKGVHFGEVIEIESKSPYRIAPECPHFDKCNGCHLLHTDYNNEIEIKKASFEKLNRNTGNSSTTLEVIPSTERLHYRNRVQLHYDKKLKVIGFHTGNKREIVAVSECRIMNPKVESKFSELLKNNAWLQKAPKNQGHVEIYDSPNGLKVNWDKDYSEGGFTQVNQSTNQRMLDKFKELIPSCDLVLDLFGGRGNISGQINYNDRFCVDLYRGEPEKGFVNLDLFDGKALEKFTSLKPRLRPDLLIVDPPRSGFKGLAQWTSHYKPKQILYVSCHPATMMRDIKVLRGSYKIKSRILIDLFPSTYHYEGAILLELI